MPVSLTGSLIWIPLAVVVLFALLALPVLGSRKGVSMPRGEALLVVGLAVVEVAIFEAMIRLDVLGAERAGETLFILLLLNFGFVQILRRTH